ncbi:hypothetical protein K502DRAFT_362158 [Neoconidiobolus thromboides FSU 785]|nr:hypothetical protein K502DRAFT_362158 [Neoconidiobolus thromboides FSU 785]
MSSEFFGVQIKPNKKYTNEPSWPLVLTMASFGQTVEKDSRTCVILKVGEHEFTICVLKENSAESQPMEVLIPSDKEFSLRVSGPNEVHLTGHYLVDEGNPEEDDEDEYPNFLDMDLDEDEESEDDDFMIDDLSEEEEENNEVGFVEEIVEEVKEEKKEPLTNAQKRKLKKQNAANAVEAEKANGKRKSEEAPVAESKKKEKKVAAKETQLKEEPKKKQAAKKEEPKKESNIKKLPNGLVIEDRVIGDGAEAKSGQRVSVRYVGKLTSGKVFDSNNTGKPFQFRLGAGEVIKGWDQGVVGMKVNGQRKLTIPAALAYGKRGAPPDIPGNATLEFEIKLLDSKKKH